MVFPAFRPLSPVPQVMSVPHPNLNLYAESNEHDTSVLEIHAVAMSRFTQMFEKAKQIVNNVNAILSNFPVALPGQLNPVIYQYVSQSAALSNTSAKSNTLDASALETHAVAMPSLGQTFETGKQIVDKVNALLSHHPVELPGQLNLVIYQFVPGPFDPNLPSDTSPEDLAQFLTPPMVAPSYPQDHQNAPTASSNSLPRKRRLFLDSGLSLLAKQYICWLKRFPDAWSQNTDKWTPFIKAFRKECTSYLNNPEGGEFRLKKALACLKYVTVDKEIEIPDDIKAKFETEILPKLGLLPNQILLQKPEKRHYIHLDKDLKILAQQYANWLKQKFPNKLPKGFDTWNFFIDAYLDKCDSYLKQPQATRDGLRMTLSSLKRDTKHNLPQVSEDLAKEFEEKILQKLNNPENNLKTLALHYVRWRTQVPLSRTNDKWKLFIAAFRDECASYINYTNSNMEALKAMLLNVKNDSRRTPPEISEELAKKFAEKFSA